MGFFHKWPGVSLLCTSLATEYLYFSDTIQETHPTQSSSAVINKEPIASTNKDQQLPRIKQTKEDDQVINEKQLNPDKQGQKSKLAATLKQLDQYEQIRKQANSQGSSQQDEDENEKEKIRKVNLYVLMLMKLRYVLTCKMFEKVTSTFQ